MGDVSDQVKIEVMLRQHGKCAICGEPLEENPDEFHHLLPKHLGGDDSVENIVGLCDRDEHLYVHGGDFRNDIETEPDIYPYFYGGDTEKDRVELDSFDEVEKTSDDEISSEASDEEEQLV